MGLSMKRLLRWLRLCAFLSMAWVWSAPAGWT